MGKIVSSTNDDSSDEDQGDNDNDNDDEDQENDDVEMKESSNKGKKTSSKSKAKRKSRSQIDEDKIAKSRIYLSPDYGEKETLLLLIPGSGAVRAGQWARSICINDNLAAGTMYPFFTESYKRDWGMIIIYILKCKDSQIIIVVVLLLLLLYILNVYRISFI